MDSRALVITGPTASGKTALSIEVARAIDGEIISMDSRQVYRGMDIGTAKPPADQRGGIRHHGFDLVTPDERYSAGRFARDARRWIDDIRERGGVPVLTGGTGFFLKALIDPFFAEPPMDPTRREALKRLLDRFDTDELARWSSALDSEAHGRRGGRQRLQRAIEVALLTGRPLPWWHRNSPPAEEPLAVAIVVLDLPRDELYRRIDDRVDDMARSGLVEEVRRLVRSGYSAGDPGMNATGYIELLPYFAGDYSLDEALERVRRATRRYARRQLTWFRNQLPPGARRIDATRSRAALAGEVVATWHGEMNA